MQKEVLCFSVKEPIHALIWYKRHLTGRYDLNEIPVIEQFVQENDICFDVGAHAGFWTRSLSQMVSKGHVYAFEALPYYARVLKIVICLLRLNNVTIVNKAVFDKPGTVTLIWKDQHGRHLTGCTHIAATHDRSIDCVTTDTITLDSLLSEIPVGSRVSFVKIDIEGAELMAVRGAVGLIEAFRPVFYLEIVNDYCKRYDYTREDLFKFFADSGYEAYTLSSSDTGIVVRPTGPASYSGKGDVLFVPSEHVFCRNYNCQLRV